MYKRTGLDPNITILCSDSRVAYRVSTFHGGAFFSPFLNI